MTDVIIFIQEFTYYHLSIRYGYVVATHYAWI